MKPDRETPKSEIEGSASATNPAAAPEQASAGREFAAGIGYDRRGVRLPAKALVGGIITPQ